MPGWGFKKGGGWVTFMSSAKSNSKRASKEEIANSKLIQHCKTTVYMGHRMQVGTSCASCIHSETCPKAGKQDYCLYRPGRFESRNLIQ